MTAAPAPFPARRLGRSGETARAVVYAETVPRAGDALRLAEATGTDRRPAKVHRLVESKPCGRLYRSVVETAAP